MGDEIFLFKIRKNKQVQAGKAKVQDTLCFFICTLLKASFAIN